MDPQYPARPAAMDEPDALLPQLLARHSETYNAAAPEYERRVAQNYEHADRRVRRIAQSLVPGGKVLEVGCGVGLNLLWLARQGFTCTGIDCSEEMVRLAKRRNPDVGVIIGDFLSHELPSSYDAIVADAVVHLFPEAGVRAFMARCRELLRPSGVLCLGTTVSASSSEGWKVKSDFAGDLMRYRREWTRQEFETLLTGDDWKILDYWELPDPRGKNWMCIVGTLA
ncbi:class I SAM-dependent methyltransferase [Streptomyces gelaticus]|uniref:class I SAM-dependent methyltransferase n=1 Tax=Streptomyces gelaticus TaxID=285446 RepID=UPI003791D668